MIKYLVLNNLVLVDSCEIHFSSNFHAITGETGAGKTAIIEAIALALGERADSSAIRKGCDRAFIEIAFAIENLPRVKELLDQSGIAIEANEELVIRREISKESKNRSFVNCRSVPLPFLQMLGKQLIDLICQSAYHSLRTHEEQREIVDLFACLKTDLDQFQICYAKEKELEKKLEDLKHLSLKRERDMETWNFQLNEIQAVALKQGEEEAVFQKYSKNAHSQELAEKIGMMIQTFSDNSSAILPQLARLIKLCEPLVKYDPSLEEVSSLMREGQIALTEALRSLQNAQDNLETDPKAFQFLENRLNEIARLKRKYGQTYEEIEAYKERLKADLNLLESIEDEMNAVEKDLIQAKNETLKASQVLTHKRKQAALKLQKTLSTHLQMLNMNGAEVKIEVLPQARSSNGEDLVQFWLKANAGENPGLIKEHSSGGELSRLLFAIKIALAEKNNTPTLIFDEIDANVGGTTASTIGDHLKELGRFRQVICITHFPQVASKADVHFGVQKTQEEGRTLTKIRPLSKKEREMELLRMIGGKKLYQEL